jgi:hypothetical protein
MVTFEIEAERDVVSARLFEPDASSHLRFGWTARSTATATIGDLVATPVRFRDYIMEGFVAYSVQLIECSPRCKIQIVEEGSDRDWSIRPQVRHYITAAGLGIRGEDVTEPSGGLERPVA